MKRFTAIILFLFVFILLSSVIFFINYTPSNKIVIAHAGGGYKNLKFTNSLEALNYNYNQGFRNFEVDLNLTSDQKIVLIHDWNDYQRQSDNFFNTIFQNKPKQYSYQEFKQLTMIKDLTQMDLNDLVIWIKNHPDCKIILDTKRNTNEVLKTIKNKYPEILNNLIAQIYYFEQYQAVKDMGYETIIFSLYKTNYNNDELLSFLADKEVYAISIYSKNILNKLPLKFKNNNTQIFIHTINDLNQYKIMSLLGIDGIYTDFLSPN